MKKQLSKVPDLFQQSGGLKDGVSTEILQKTGVPEAEAYGVGSFYHLLSDPNTKVRVCSGLSCKLKGSDKILQAAQKAGLPVEECSCLAACDEAPALLRDRDTLPSVTVEDIQKAGTEWKAIRADHQPKDKPWFGTIGKSDPEKSAINLHGSKNYTIEAFNNARNPETVIKEIEISGLQGRGGAGFPAFIKWNAVRQQTEKTRYVVLNADEGEPGTFKDREIMMRRPDLVIEGLAIAARTVEAKDIYLYLRGEFTFPAEQMKEALQNFQDNGHFTEFNFHFHYGQGAYICGEETALLEALEGKRGMPRLKPPFPVEKGLWQKPTLIHNVETIACLPSIMINGGAWFKDLGRTGAGIKMYCISGHVKNPGTYEMPLGITLDELVEAAGGYIGTPKAYSPGGASSGFLPISKSNVPLDFKSLATEGTMLGSAGVVVLNDTVNMQWAASRQLVFFEDESCGQCAPCRIGTRYLREALDNHINGAEHDNCPSLEYTDDVSFQMTEGSICGLGQIASLPLTSAQKYFPEDFQNDK